MSKNAQKTSSTDLAIGDLPLGGRAMLAPMSGVSDLGMRRIARQFGASLVISEMVASDDYVRGGAEARLRAQGEGIAPHVVQIAGCDATWMAEAARIAEGAGADIIDINMGCPAKRVTGGWAGSALMRDLDLAQRLIEATVAAVRIPVTLKMRLGWDEASLNASDLARRAETCGVKLLTIHGRTRSMFYKGKADWRAIRAIKASVAIPVVANGDCGSIGDARLMLEQSGADAVMVGRAAVGRPWLVGAIALELASGVRRPEPSARDRSEAALGHFETLLSLMGPQTGLRHSRKHLAAYAEHAGAGCASPGLARDRLRLVTSESASDVRRLLASFFEDRNQMEAA